MPRYRRRWKPGTVQHLITRFVNREYRLDHPGAREEYLLRFGACVERTDWSALSLALMSTHTHGGVVAGEMHPRRLMHPLNSGFAGWLNKAENRLGPVFAERFRNIQCEEEQAATLIAYIHNNPVRAGVVKSPEASSWTSHPAYIGERKPPPWLNVELGLGLCGFSSSPSGRLAFHDFVRAEASRERDAILSALGLNRHRARIRRELGAPVEICSPQTKGSGEPLRLEVDCLNEVQLRCRREIAIQEVITRVAASARVHVAEMTRRTRRADVVRARRLALILWVCELGHPQIAMARALGISASTASHHIRAGLESVELCDWARGLALHFRHSLTGSKPAA